MIINQKDLSELSEKGKKDLEIEIAEGFKIYKNSFEEWNYFVSNFYEKCSSNYPQIFKTKENLKTFNLTIDDANSGDILINNREFYFSVSFKKNDQLNFIDFYQTKFFGKVDFTSKKFEGRTFFEDTRFESEVNFCNSVFAQDVSFVGSYFDGEVDFYLAKFVKDVRVLGCNFGKNATLRFTKSVFSGNHFELHSSKEGNPIKEIYLDGAVFYCPAVFDLKFESCPDFSKAHFLSKLIINETWLDEGETISDSEIRAEHESKFRFLKKYFAEQGNHFKEQEYFSYEMMAREKLLWKKFFAEEKFYNWLKNFSEFVLFFLYKWTSNFGMSWFRPLFWLVISALVMCYYIEVPTKNYFGFFNEFFVFRTEGISFVEAILKTVSPLSTAEEFKHSLSVKMHCLINAALIFLIGLGIRNKFKIK